MSDPMWAAFADELFELEKEAGVVGSTARWLGRRIAPEGTGAYLKGVGQAVKEAPLKTVSKAPGALWRSTKRGWTHTWNPGSKAQWSRNAKTGKLTYAPEVKGKWEKATWMGTGKGMTGRVGKYLPVGQKSQQVLMTGAFLPDALKKEDPYGEGRSRAERLGGFGAMTAAFMAMGGARVPMLPSLLLSTKADELGGAAVKKVEGLFSSRPSGKPVRRAVSAYRGS